MWWFGSQTTNICVVVLEPNRHYVRGGLGAKPRPVLLWFGSKQLMLRMRRTPTIFQGHTDVGHGERPWHSSLWPIRCLASGSVSGPAVVLLWGRFGQPSWSFAHPSLPSQSDVNSFFALHFSQINHHLFSLLGFQNAENDEKC